MNKDQLCKLLEEMTPSSVPVNSADDPSWHAHRRAEKLHNAQLLPMLREIIEEREKKTDKELRRNAYFVLGQLLRKEPEPAYCQFFVDRLQKETDKYVLDAMLTSIARMHLPSDVNIEAIIACSRNEKWLIRHNAINALQASHTEASREAVRYWVRQEDEKQYKYELIYANASLGYIGEEADIQLLETHTHSRIRDVKQSALFAIDNIRRRLGLDV